MAYLPSKPRYEILDGLRGVAAMMVVAFHLFETYSFGDPTKQIINHGYMGVDFFFVLSGFVIGYAYDDRWGKMSTWDFFKRRLTRLHPMLMFGTVFGALMFYFAADPNVFPMLTSTPVWAVLVVALVGCTMIPLVPWWDIRGWAETYPLNGPAWTLFYEYIANILYALVVRHFPRWLLIAFVAASAFLTIDLALNLDVWGLLGGRGNAAYTMIGGWCLDATQVYIGITRLLYPFFMGLLLSRLGWKLSARGGFWWCSLALVIIFAMPWIGEGETMWLNGLYCAVAVLLVFPTIVALGAGSPLKGKTSVAWCKWLGAISYPLYITHYPLIYCQMTWALTHPEAPVATHVFVSVATFFLAIGTAWAAYRLYDLPVREWLRKHWLAK